MKHFVRSTLVVLSLCSVPALSDPSAKAPAVKGSEEIITVRAGNAKTVKAPGMTRLALEDPEIADASISGTDVVRIQGIKAGETVLLVWTGKARKAYRIVVQ
ncbi:MAG: pilus assembly protein N-terminal domain-containing protein [Hyalangium sp.]|uniref:pilus assembly protein N-terminal domain-containing protein n=1 Tax=Hyalangium sp. TaxID=2028555 RepID=UPI00389A418F